MNNASFVGSFTGEGAVGVASLDPPLIQQTKSEIRTLAGEIAKLAHAACEPAEFYRGFLPRLVTAMGAEGAAVWQTCDSLRSHGKLDSSDEATQASGVRLLAQHCLARELLDCQLLDCQEQTVGFQLAPSEAHRKILDCVIAEGTPILVPPQTVSIEVDRPANPLEHSIIIVPVRIEDDVEFVLEVVQPASGGPAAQRGYLRFVAQMADLLADYLRRHSLREHSAQAARLQQFEFWLSEIALTVAPSSQLRLLADGLSDLLDSHQVFIVRSGRRPKVLAASGLATFDPRSETIMAAELVERFLQRQVGAREAYLDLQAWKVGDQRLTSVSKLFELLASDKLVRLRLHEERDAVALLALPASSVASPAEMQRVASSLFGLVAPQATSSIWARSWMPWRTLSRTSDRSHRSARQTWVMRGALAGLATVIAFFPVPQQITTTAVLAPTLKNCYYAPADATVTRVIHAEGEYPAVKKGAELLVLESVALNQRIGGLEAEIDENSTHLASLHGRLAKAIPNSADSGNIITAIDQTRLKIVSQTLEKEALDQEKSKLTIVALEDGELTAWDIANRLQGRPVARGELLLSTSDPRTAWELQVSVPEHRVGLVSDALAGSSNGTVPLRFSLTSHPNVPMQGALTWMADQTTRNAAGANVVLSKAAVIGELPLKKEGAIARVTLDCGFPLTALVTRTAGDALALREEGLVWAVVKATAITAMPRSALSA